MAVAHECIGSLVGLKELALANLRLTRMPEWLRNLRALRDLWLDRNALTELPDWFGDFPNLAHLDVRLNRLTSLPASLRRLESLTELILRGNPDLGIPAEISEDNAARKILDYYFRTAKGARQPLNEFKLILVGRGGVGKTTLVHRLVTGKYKEFKRTSGIQITKWPVTIDGAEVRAHVWDFGGQEIMHGTHRFFMTERALCLVLLSGREGSEDHDAEYWLSLVRSFAGDVPIIVLLNKWDDYAFELNRQLLREKYGGSIVFLETDSSSGKGVLGLREQICRFASALPGLKAAWPAQWRRVKEELPQKRASWLTYDAFREFCAERGVGDRKEQEDLAESLHDLGLMLSYRREEALKSFGVLNPQWVTRGIYQILNSPALRDAGGKFTVRSFADVLPTQAYPAELHPFLLGLMRKFRLCHPLDDKGSRHLIPELLTKEEPKLDAQFPPEECLGFIYRYEAVLPEGLLPRFIVDTYVHREPKHAWRTGVVLERANCRALVRGDIHGRTVMIRVAGVGNGRRELLGIIREHFERIHRSYEKLPVTELVPIPGHPDTHVAHELLLKYERNRRPTIAVALGEQLEDFPVGELLDGVDLPAVRASSKFELADELPMYSLMTSVFISYSHKDSAYLDQLRAALVPYERARELDIWCDSLVEPGQEWGAEITSRLRGADIVMLLLSNDFLRSDYCMDKELPGALGRHLRGECVVVPVVVRACRFDKLELGAIQAILPNGKPVAEHDKTDRAWFEVTKQLDRVIARIEERNHR